MIAFTRDPSASRDFRIAFEERPKLFCVVKLERFSLNWATFLDFEIYKSPPNGEGVIKFKPYVKKTARHLPLSSSSYHPANILRAWPLAEMSRMSRRSSDREAARVWQKAKIWKLQHHFFDSRVVALCKEWQPAVPSVVARGFLANIHTAPRELLVRLVLPLRREWSGIASKLKALSKQYQAFIKAETGC